MKEGNKMSFEKYYKENFEDKKRQSSLKEDHRKSWEAGRQYAFDYQIHYKWQSPDNPPPSDGERRLVMLRKNNILNLSDEHPIIAKYGLYIIAPNNWTYYYNMDNVNITKYVIAWTDLPKYTPS